MCGISGIVNTGGIELHQIKAMSDIIRYRGPDDEGITAFDCSGRPHCSGGNDTPPKVWSSKFSFTPTKKTEGFQESKFNVAFGHRRLSIIDLSPAGHQPMSYENDRYWIIFNGEIYNYQDIKLELQNLGHRFISRTDTEVVLAAYAEWREACLNRFVGMWAFAIYDVIKKVIFLSRDRYGIKPLYYWFSPENGFYFASEIKQFTVCNTWEARINPEKAYDYLIYSFTDHSDETMFSGVFHLPPGCSYRSPIDQIKPDTTGRINYRKWYNLRRDPFKGDFEEAASVFRMSFERAVREHLFADVPVGTALSGGLDSSSIVCEVNKILRDNGKTELQKTFSSCAFNEKYDESYWMKIIVEYTKVNAHFIYPTLNEVSDLTSQIIWHQDEPYQSQSAFLAYNVFKLASDNGVKVLLNGQGADEYLGGYGQFSMARYANMLKHLRLIPMIFDIRNRQKINRVSYQSLIHGVTYHLLPSSIRLGIANYRSHYDQIKNIIDTKKLRINPTHPYKRIPVGYVTVPEISEHLTFFSTLPKYLRWEDRNSMAHSVEARVPFLDHRLVEFTYSLPDDFLEKDGITKRVMRVAMDGLLPEKIKNRKDKKGFITPEEIWVKNENPAYFRSKISDAVFGTYGIIKSDALDYFDKIIDGKIPFDYTYWRLIQFSEWMRKFMIKI
jgi:asparagine synthase (glutamine-hydrolysing)